MKPKIFIITIITITLTILSAVAYVLSPFDGWDRVEKMSPDIVVVNCWKPTPPTPGVDFVGPDSDYQVGVVSVLKGTNATTSARLLTDHPLQIGRTYLV